MAVSSDLLADLWRKHVECEFSTRDTEATLATMTEDAYVNHVPVMTGGVGKQELHKFYAEHFIPKMPPTRSSRRYRSPAATIRSSMRCCFNLPIPSKWIGCCRASHRPAGRSRFHSSRSSSFGRVNSPTSTSTGIRRRCWLKSGYSIPQNCRFVESNRPARYWIPSYRQ